MLGFENPDARPPFGMWACLYEVASGCDWENHDKPPQCFFVELQVAESVCVDLRSIPYTAYDCKAGARGKEPQRSKLAYSGPEGGMWTLAGESLSVIGIEPSTGKLRAIASILGGYIIYEGSCINIEK